MKNELFKELPAFPEAPVTSRLSYLSRLNRVWEAMAPDSVFILSANPECSRSNDTHFPYRQSSDIVYLNGFPEPKAVLILSKLKGAQNFIMLVQPKDKERETWDGIREGVLGAKKNYLCKSAHNVEDFQKVLGKLLKSAKVVYYRFGQNPELDGKFRQIWEAKQPTLRNPDSILDELRLVKSEEELSIMRHACRVTAEAHKQAMLACKPGMSENQLQAIIEFVFKYAGATAPAYGSIVASGNNACVLHYVENDDKIADGSLVLIDAGCEFGSRNGGYAADITRTFPANGKFSKPQRQLYELVLEAQLAAIAAAKPGARLIHVHQAAERVLRRGLIKLGLLPETASPDGMTLDDFMPHGTSHWLGIDVHDVGSYDDSNEVLPVSAKRRLLEPGMVITVEPGIYINKNEKRVPPRFRGIGIRIEDDLAITSDGNEVLTAAVPKSVEDIETLMAGAAG